jgi:hypothetical protein
MMETQPPLLIFQSFRIAGFRNLKVKMNEAALSRWLTVHHLIESLQSSSSLLLSRFARTNSRSGVGHQRFWHLHQIPRSARSAHALGAVTFVSSGKHREGSTEPKSSPLTTPLMGCRPLKHIVQILSYRILICQNGVALSF